MHEQLRQRQHGRRTLPLDELDNFKAVDGYTDIRGFEAYTEDGRQVGEVDQLLV